jgi:ankyrin repeat protein
VRALLDGGADATLARNNGNGGTPLMIAKEMNYPEIVALLEAAASDATLNDSMMLS